MPIAGPRLRANLLPAPAGASPPGGSGPGPGRTAGMVARLHPPSQPYEQGMLAVGDGNHVYWSAAGHVWIILEQSK